MALILSGGHALVHGKVLPADVMIDGGEIVAVGAVPHRGCETMDASGHVIVPGLRNTHMHAATSLIQGMPADGALDEWVANLWKFEQGLSGDEAYWGALWSCISMLQAGVTYFEDMHFLEQHVARACEQSGIRASLSEALMDMQPWDSPSSVKSSLSLARHVQDIPTLSAKMGIVSVRMTSDSLVSQACEAYNGNAGLFEGFHLHIDEVPADRAASISQYGMTPTQYFYNKGVLSPSTIVAHYVHPSPDDIKIMAASGAEVSHCLGSNMRLGSGYAPIAKMIAAGVRISLGIDSPSIHDGYSLWPDVRCATLTHQIDIAHALAMLCGNKGITAGMPADLVLLKKDHFFPYRSMSSLLVHGLTDSAVDHVFVNGTQVVCNGTVTTVDVEQVRKQALTVAERAWSRLECGE